MIGSLNRGDIVALVLVVVGLLLATMVILWMNRTQSRRAPDPEEFSRGAAAARKDYLERHKEPGGR